MKLNCTFFLILTIFNLCKSSDIETDLENGVNALLTLKGNYSADQLKTLTAIGDWGTMAAMSMGRAGLLLIDDSADFKEDEGEQIDKEKLDAINAALAQVESEFKIYEVSLKLQNYLINLKDIQTKLQTVSNAVQSLTSQSENGEIKEDDKKALLQMYKEQLSDVSENIYSTLAKNKDAFMDAAKFYKNHRKQTFQYMKIASVLLFKSVAMDITFQLLKDGGFEDGMKAPAVDEILERNYELWQPRFSTLGKTVQEMDDFLMNIWTSQYIEDFNYMTFVKLPKSEMYAKEMHEFFEDKYFWRRWFVMVIPDWKNNGDKFDVNTCGGFEKIKSQGKNFFIKSVESLEQNLNNKYLAELRLKTLVANPLSLFGFFPAKATKLNEEMMLSCQQFDMFGSVSEDADVSIYGNHVFAITTVKDYWLFKSSYISFIMV